MYRPPNTNVNEFLDTFQKLCKGIRDLQKDCIIGLDHNLDLIKQSIHQKTQEFIENILDNNLLPTITKPTRISKSSATLIDNVKTGNRL